MKIAHATPELWNGYCSFFTDREVALPPSPELLVLVEHEGVLLAGVGLYPTKAAYLLVENLATNPNASPRLRLRAVKMAIKAVIGTSTVLNKVPLTILRHKSLAKLAKDAGFQHIPGQLWVKA